MSCGDQHGPVRGAPLFSATNPARPEISPPANERRLIPPKSNRTSCHSLRSLVMFLFLTFVLFYFRLHTTGVSHRQKRKVLLAVCDRQPVTAQGFHYYFFATIACWLVGWGQLYCFLGISDCLLDILQDRALRAMNR